MPASLHLKVPSFTIRLDAGDAFVCAGAVLIWGGLAYAIGPWKVLAFAGGLLATAFIIVAVDMAPEIWAALVARYGAAGEGEGR